MTKDLAPVITRIIMRYLSGALGTWGIVAGDDFAAIVAILVAAGLGMISEIWHAKVMRK
jgi:hypothetical protein